MTGHDLSFSEALKMVDCSESTLRRKLREDGSRLGATKLKRGWSIPITTLEALGVMGTVTGQGDDSLTGRDRSGDRSPDSQELVELRDEITRLKVDNATLRERVSGLEALLSERTKVVALLESRPARPRHWWQRWSRGDDLQSDDGVDSPSDGE